MVIQAPQSLASLRIKHAKFSKSSKSASSKQALNKTMSLAKNTRS
jgi:hypothetical protein